MITIKYDSWEKISINRYKQLQNAINNIEDVGDNEINVLNQNITIISILADVDEDVVADLTTHEFSKLIGGISFLKEMPKPKPKPKYRLNGIEYELNLDFKQMTMSQYIDYHTLAVDKQKNIVQLLACFLIPKGKKYCEGYRIEDAINDIGNYLSAADAYSLLFFFALIYRSLMRATLNYLNKKMMKLQKKKMNEERRMEIERGRMEILKILHLLKDGDGFGM